MKTKKLRNLINLFICLTIILTMCFTVNAYALTNKTSILSPDYFLAIEYVDVVGYGDGTYKLTIYPIGNFSYSFDGGYNWQKSNTATIHTNERTWEVAMRDSNTYVAYYTVELPPKDNDIQDVDVWNYGDGSFKITIYPEGDFVYSFDGGNIWQRNNTKVIYSNETTLKVAMMDPDGYVSYYTAKLPTYRGPYPQG